MVDCPYYNQCGEFYEWLCNCDYKLCWRYEMFAREEKKTERKVYRDRLRPLQKKL